LLSTTITFHNTLDEKLLTDLPFIKKTGTNHYQIYLTTGDKSIGEIVLSENDINIHYSGELMLTEYIIIHDIIVKLQTALNADVDDSKSFLGYLPNGETVHIIKNWEKWVSYIYSSMENCKNIDASSY
jgi:hypothetical protein